MKRSSWFFLFLLVIAMLTGLRNASAQAHRSRLEQGISLYRAGYWTDAALELRRSRMEAANTGQAAESLYWLSLTEFALGEYGAALRDMGELQVIAPAGLRIDNILYYKGRSLYYVNRPEEALAVFRLQEALLERSRLDTPQGRAQKLTLAYWIGECLYSLGRLDQAAELFSRVANAEPRVEKYEAASYRLAMIRQNRLQAEILGMLDWSYSEYLRLAEEYRRLEAAYNEVIAAWQRQAAAAPAPTPVPAPVPAPTPVPTPDYSPVSAPVDAGHRAELEARVSEYRLRLNEAEERIRSLELRLGRAEEASPDSFPLAPGQEDAIRRIRELKAEAQRLRDSLMP
jgi:TolA-binding protein